MFHVTCPTTGDALRSVEAIVEQANTPEGVITALSCRCGGHLVLRNGDQVAHLAPGEQTPTPMTASTPAAA